MAFKTNKRLTTNQIIHIWVFTIAFQTIFDTIIEFKFHGYWYFRKEINWIGIFPHTVLIPPVNMMFLNWYPFQYKIPKQISYIFVYVIVILFYEAITLLPEPWGFFHNGWWKLWHSAIVDPILFLILLGYYKWVQKAGKMLINH
jgi:hypothetical protein